MAHTTAGRLRRHATVVARIVCAAGVLSPAALWAGPVPIAPEPRMGEPIVGLTPAQLARFDAGRIDFMTPFTAADGLGPTFNFQSCSGCHISPIGGQGARTVVRFGALAGNLFDPLDELGGSLLQAQAISPDCGEEVPFEANVTANRVTNGAQGYGLIEAIDDADLIALENSPPPGVSGRAHLVEPLEALGQTRVGRFGWKAQQATILSFSADAAINEMGITNRFFPDEVDPNGNNPPDVAACDEVPDPEDGPDGEGLHFIDRVTDFLRFMTAPPQAPRSGLSGEAIFDQIGCGSCHVAPFTTRDDPALEDALRNKSIRPYSDFLLHDMGASADSIAQGDASPTEMRTAPLWGLISRTRMWHDGHFLAMGFTDLVLNSIAEHDAPGSESAASAGAFASLSAADKALVVTFLASLGRIHFDANSDEEVRINDFIDFVACFAGSAGGPYSPDDACAIHDVDQDGDVDLDDYAAFELAFGGPFFDCNGNGELDITDIITGASPDANGDGAPDDCDQCPWDLDHSGAVGFADLVQVLMAYGPCPGGATPCTADFDGNGSVGFSDITQVLVHWGACG